MKTYYTVILEALFGAPHPMPVHVQLNCGCKAFEDKDWVQGCACERIWAGLNRGSRSEFPAFLNYPIRSMCEEDYVYDHQLKCWFQAATIGFEPVDPPQHLPKSIPEDIKAATPLFTA